MTDKTDEIAQTLNAYNEAYRKGSPLVSDAEYDRLVETLRGLDPDHPFLYAVEPEAFTGKNEIRHPIPMLSTDKAYTKEALERFVTRVCKAAKDMLREDIIYRVTPKLDGLAGRDDGGVLASRGNGEVGYDISNAFLKGVIPVGGRGLGVGEIVVKKSYFEEHLSNVFEHPRNMVVGIVSSDTLNESARKALEDQAVHFVPYSQLAFWEGDADTLLRDVDEILADLAEQTDYPMDGAVAEVMKPEIREAMGATAHHYRWQIAIKTKGDTAVTVVDAVTWQVGRTGNVTPVMEVKPVSLSGATIRRVTAHHAGMVLKEKIGPGSEIEIIRSGEVIPKLEKVLKPSRDVSFPSMCPVCQTRLVWQNDFLKCDNRLCRAQIEQGISHWFKTLGTADWFGIKTIQKLVENGYDSLEKIYALTQADLTGMGFGPVQSRNLEEALDISKNKPVEDWRFLAALGISNLGTGDSRKLLSHMTLQDLLEADRPHIEEISGFGGITSQSIHKGIQDLRKTIDHLLSLGFNLVATPLVHEAPAVKSAIAGKGIVFTGKMRHGSREAMQSNARRLGARVQTAVSGTTDILVCGDKVGAAKISKAKVLGVEILSEDTYIETIKKG
jgi:DNA ligase (NAD+)